MLRNFDQIALGQRIIAARESVGLKQADLARALDTTTTSVCRWETGKKPPGLKNIRKIASLTRSSVDYLMTGEVPDAISGAIPFSRHQAFLRWLKSEDAENITEDEKISLASLRFRHEPRTRRYTNVLEQLRNDADQAETAENAAKKNRRNIK